MARLEPVEGADQAVAEKIQIALPALTPDHIIANCATVDLDSTLQAAEIVAEAGAAFLDCPFTGSKDAAENGQLSYYVGGDPEVIERARPLLEHSSASIIPIGAIGHATIVKIATNMVTATTIQVLSEALAVSIAHGVEPQTFQAAVENNACNSKVTGMKLPAMIAGDYEPHFSLNNMFKDSQFALTLAKQAGLDIPALATTAGAMFQTIKAGHGEEDFCSIFSRFASHES